MSTFVVVWALMVAPADGGDLVLGGSHYYWTEPVCLAAAERMAEHLETGPASPAPVDAKPTFAMHCVPFMRERASSRWLQDNVIGPCEPRYDDCAGLGRAEFDAMVATARRWKALMGSSDDAGQSGNPPSPPRSTSAQRMARFERIIRGSQ